MGVVFEGQRAQLIAEEACWQWRRRACQERRRRLRKETVLPKPNYARRKE